MSGGSGGALSTASLAPATGRLNASGVRWFGTGVVIVGLVAAHVACLGSYGYFRDELYYLACGRRLAWGYVDHPPLVAVMAWVAEHLFGTSVEALRILPLVLVVGLVPITVAIVRRLGGGPFAQVLASVAVAVAPHYLFAFHYLSMNSAEIVLWAAAMWLLLIAIDSGADRMVYAGPVLSHYEFETPIAQRKSDAEWRQDHAAGRLPPRPEWTTSYLVPGVNPRAKGYPLWAGE